MKINTIRTVIVATAFFTFGRSFAQEGDKATHVSAPIPIEVFLGADNWTSQLVIDKKFVGSNKLGIFALSYLRANYDNNPYLSESLNLAMVKYNLYKNVSLLSGVLYSSHWGFRPYAGAQYNYHSRTFMGMINSGFHLTETKNFETIAMVEYRPVIKEAWSLYTKMQGMYSQNTLIDEHDRSYIYNRIGVSYKAFSFGCALNYDWYGFGPMKIKDHQWGIFVSTIL